MRAGLPSAEVEGPPMLGAGVWERLGGAVDGVTLNVPYLALGAARPAEVPAEAAAAAGMSRDVSPFCAVPLCSTGS